jgi:hypothetical protein
MCAHPVRRSALITSVSSPRNGAEQSYAWGPDNPMQRGLGNPYHGAWTILPNGARATQRGLDNPIQRGPSNPTQRGLENPYPTGPAQSYATGPSNRHAWARTILCNGAWVIPTHGAWTILPNGARATPRNGARAALHDSANPALSPSLRGAGRSVPGTSARSIRPSRRAWSSLAALFQTHRRVAASRGRPVRGSAHPNVCAPTGCAQPCARFSNLRRFPQKK